jgi:hypothetical protein
VVLLESRKERIKRRGNTSAVVWTLKVVFLLSQRSPVCGRMDIVLTMIQLLSALWVSVGTTAGIRREQRVLGAVRRLPDPVSEAGGLIRADRQCPQGYNTLPWNSS